MINLLAQTSPYNFWAKDPATNQPIVWMIIGLIVGIAVVTAIRFAPASARKPIIWIATFLPGLFFFLLWLWPQPINRGGNDIPRGTGEQFSFWLEDALPRIADIANILTVFMLGLGIFSLLRIHITRLAKKQKDSFFSGVLIFSLVLMVIFGYWDWSLREFNDPEGKLLEISNWGFPNYGFDLLFNGLLQQMEAAMFSMIAFFILSAAYRAFRVRSIEATVLMASALIMIFSIMGAVDFFISGGIDSMTGGDPGNFLNNFKLTAIAQWVKNYLQVPSLRALEFGVGLGALAMGLRLWLGLEKGIN